MDSPCCWEVLWPQTSTSSCCSRTATGAFWDKYTRLSCVLCRTGYSSTIWLSQPNSCWNVVGHFVCNNTYWKTTAEILTHDFLVYGRHHWRKSQVIGSLQNGLTTTWGDFQLPSKCEWVWGWFCHPHSQMKISKNRWTWWNSEFLWVWTWQNLKVRAKIEK